MKYVMFNSPLSGEIPFIFPNSFTHINMVQLMNSKYPGIKHISAGFVKFSSGEPYSNVNVHCSGYSQSLKENNVSREIDNKIIEICLK